MKNLKAEGVGVLANNLKSDRPVRLIAFVCDAGMGSSAMGATTFRKKLEKAGYPIAVKHYAIENIPADADIIVTHASLEDRARGVTDKPLILIKNYLGDQTLDVLFEQLTTSDRLEESV